MPQQGEVGGGHQNDWKKQGTIYEKHPKLSSSPVKFKKGNVTKNTNRNDNECWTAGTPVVWNDDQDPSQAKTITAPVAGIPDMLVSRDPYTQEITEYHPLITFFNEVMARIMRDGHRDWLSNLEKEENAIKLWQYLDEKYLKPSEKVGANGSAQKEVV
ncbi:MAG TPA: hypothetical protein VFZ52_17705 [Chryseolinea sp.]